MARAQLDYLRLRFLGLAGAGTLRNALASAVKRAIGRQAFYEPSEIVFRALVLNRLGLRPPLKITSRSLSGEGGGSQVRLAMCAITYARLLGLDYVHTPFSDIAHGDRPMESWAKAWEAQFNLGAGESPADPNDAQILDMAMSYRLLTNRFGSNDFLGLFDLTAPEFRRKYYSNKAKRKNGVLTIAVHVRRSDVAHGGHRVRWSELDDVVGTVRQVRDILSQRRIDHRIQLFSDGGEDEFRALEELGAEPLLNKDPLWTIGEMVEADIFVMGRGFFSYVPAVISDGIKLFEPWGYPALDGWIVRGSNGKFDAAEFSDALERLLNSPEWSLL